MPPFNPMVERLLWIFMALLVPALMTFGAVSPWPAAAEKLAAVGPGPYVPLSFFYRSHTNGTTSETHRTQTYLVASRVSSSLSTYRVSQENSVVAVEELKFGLLYGVAFLLAFYVITLWRVLHLSRI